eukprot:Hpha_TRINITY_DN15955_c1_g2::TRINITY_DN15955_c1_g2_i1::g.70776::m.70776/K09522/DNAJC2; DnaJ homolog subfamily C member 2
MGLPQLPGDFGSSAVVYGAPTVPPLSVVVECCGKALEAGLDRWSHGYETAEQKLRRVASHESVGHEDGRSSPEKEQEKEKQPKGKKKVTATKLTEAEIEEDHYENLGFLEGMGVAATEEHIRKIVRQKSMETHPDKTGGDDTMFKKVQLASEVLLNADKRRAYDSSLPFDDDIPPVKVTPERFYRVFGACFAANSRWYDGKKEDLPSLGDDDTDLDVVEKFYDFWYGFKSWRDFSHEVADDLYDLTEAEDRWERRRMERENAKLLEKAKKREKSRLTELTERAYKNDPRLIARERALLAERKAKAEAREREEQERIREAREAEEKRKRQEEEAKAAAKDLKAATKKARQNFRRLVAPVEGAGGWPSLCSVSRLELDWLLGRSNYETITDLSEKARAVVDAPVEGGVQPLAFLLHQTIEAEEQRSGETRSGAQLAFREGFWGCEEVKKLYAVWSKSKEDFAAIAAEMQPRSEEDCRKKVQQLEKVSADNSAHQAEAAAAAAKKQAAEEEAQRQLEAAEEEKKKKQEAARKAEEEKKEAKAKQAAGQKSKKDQQKMVEHEGSKRRTNEKEEAAARTPLFQQYSTVLQRYLKERAKAQAVDDQKRAKECEKELKKIAKQQASNEKQQEDRRSALQEKEDKEFSQLLEKEKVDRAEAKKGKSKAKQAKPAPKAAAPKPAPKQQQQQQQQPKPAAKPAPKAAPKPAPKMTFVVNERAAEQPKQKGGQAEEDGGAWGKVPKSGGKKKK